MSETQLPPFPVDDVTLDLIEHSLGASLDFSESEDAPVVVGADMTLSDLLRFLSGWDETKLVLVSEGRLDIPGIGGAAVYEYPDPQYSEHDVLRALIGEIRRLRSEVSL